MKVWTPSCTFSFITSWNLLSNSRPGETQHRPPNIVKRSPTRENRSWFPLSRRPSIPRPAADHGAISNAPNRFVPPSLRNWVREKLALHSGAYNGPRRYFVGSFFLSLTEH